MNAYATPVLLGGPQFKMMGPLVFGQFRLNNWPFGAAIAFVLMTATLVLTASANLLMQRAATGAAWAAGRLKAAHPAPALQHVLEGARRGLTSAAGRRGG